MTRGWVVECERAHLFAPSIKFLPITDARNANAGDSTIVETNDARRVLRCSQVEGTRDGQHAMRAASSDRPALGRVRPARGSTSSTPISVPAEAVLGELAGQRGLKCGHASITSAARGAPIC